MRLHRKALLFLVLQLLLQGAYCRVASTEDPVGRRRVCYECLTLKMKENEIGKWHQLKIQWAVIMSATNA